jgi:hypothetical protein
MALSSERLMCGPVRTFTDHRMFTWATTTLFSTKLKGSVIMPIGHNSKTKDPIPADSRRRKVAVNDMLDDSD